MVGHCREVGAIRRQLEFDELRAMAGAGASLSSAVFCISVVFQFSFDDSFPMRVDFAPHPLCIDGRHCRARMRVQFTDLRQGYE